MIRTKTEKFIREDEKVKQSRTRFDTKVITIPLSCGSMVTQRNCIKPPGSNRDVHSRRLNEIEIDNFSEMEINRAGI